MPLVVNTRSFTVDNIAAQAVTYRDPSATALLPASLKLARTDPKPTTSFPGVSKTEAKISKKAVVASVAWPALIRMETSIPAGMADVDLDLLIADFRSFTASTAFAALVKQGTIYYA